MEEFFEWYTIGLMLSITAFHRDGPEVNIESDQISFQAVLLISLSGTCPLAGR